MCPAHAFGGRGILGQELEYCTSSRGFLKLVGRNCGIFGEDGDKSDGYRLVLVAFLHESWCAEIKGGKEALLRRWIVSHGCRARVSSFPFKE